MAKRKSTKQAPREAPPLSDAQLRRRLKERPPLKDVPVSALEFTLPVRASARVEAIRREGLDNGLRVAVSGVRPGERFVRPSVPGTRLRKRLAGRESASLSGYLPDHLALKPVPDRLPRDLRVRPRLDLFHPRRRRQKYTTTVFNPENRYTFNDTAFPWCTVGRVDTPAGGPFFAWWDNEPWPRVVGVQSWENATDNGASGGQHLVQCIIAGLTDFP